MSLREKVILASMIMKGVATFGLMAYTFVNFVSWMMEHREEIDDVLSEDIIEVRIE